MLSFNMFSLTYHEILYFMLNKGMLLLQSMLFIAKLRAEVEWRQATAKYWLIHHLTDLSNAHQVLVQFLKKSIKISKM